MTTPNAGQFSQSSASPGGLAWGRPVVPAGAWGWWGLGVLVRGEVALESQHWLWKASRSFPLSLAPQPIQGAGMIVVCSSLLSPDWRGQVQSQVWNTIIPLQLALHKINLPRTLWPFGLARSQEQFISFITKADVVGQVFKNYSPPRSPLNNFLQMDPVFPGEAKIRSGRLSKLPFILLTSSQCQIFKVTESNCFITS